MNAISSPAAAALSILPLLRDARWLTPSRAWAYGWILLLVTVGVTLAWGLLSCGGMDLRGMPLGSDFVAFWTASRLSLAGRPFEPYDLSALRVAQEALLGSKTPFFAFFYPPPFLLVCLPLALVSYPLALASWLCTTMTAYLLAVRRFLPSGSGLMPLIAFPAAFVTITHGQNAFLTTALFASGVWWLDRRPVLAGACLGVLIIKPHLVILVPFALFATRRWIALIACAGSAAVLCGLSLLVFGPETWSAFFQSSRLARLALEDDIIGFGKMQSVFAAVRLLGGSATIGYALQATVALAAFAGLVAMQRRCPESKAFGPGLVITALLTSPFLLDYDLTLLAIPLAWMVNRGVTDGFLPWEKTGLVCGFMLPALSRPLALATGFPLAPIVIVMLLILLIRRGTFHAVASSSTASAAKNRLTAATA